MAEKNCKDGHLWSPKYPKIFSFFLSFSEINSLFLFVCSVLQSAWMNQEIFDLVHPDDAEKIRDQLSATESPDAGRVLDLKSK